MRLLYPSDPFLKPLVPDDIFAEEYAAATAAGLSCSLFRDEELSSGRFKPSPPILPGETVLYRGWMLTPDAYAWLATRVDEQSGVMLTSPRQYRLCHWLPEWYPLCEGLTPRTLILSQVDEVSKLLIASVGWRAYFVKDYVKSLTTARGSVARSIEEIDEVVTLLKHYRGTIEGGICVRELEDLRPDTEERYFVLKGKAFHRDGGSVPIVVLHVAKLISSPFFSIDVALDAQGDLRVIELGDGQVSDRKRWTAERYAQMLTECL